MLGSIITDLIARRMPRFQIAWPRTRSRFLHLFIVVSLILGSPSLMGRSSAIAQTVPERIDWSPLGTDLEKAEFSITVGTMFTSSIILVRSSLDRYAMRVVRASEFGWRRASVRALCKKSAAAVCINANFFDEQGKALGLVISRGIIHHKTHQSGGTLTAILYVTPNSVKIIHRDSFSGAGAVEAVQAGPRLIAGGKAVQGLHESALSSNLSGACIDVEGRLVIFRVTSGVFGCSMNQLQEILLHPSIRCRDAINFDGGGSSQLYVSDELSGNSVEAAEISLTGVDSVPVAIGLFDTKR